jgi:DNA-binding transcriptional ArsR family regulator
LPQRVPARIELKPAQQQALAALSEGGLAELSRGAYQELTGMSRSQAAYDLADLVEAGLLQRVGGGRSTRYRLPQERQAPTHRRWTPERIRAGLARLCEGRTTWPSAQEFKAAGRGDLYVAASRYGGIAFWAAELGLPKASEAVQPRRPRRLSWAVAGAFSGALLAVAAAVAVQPWLESPQKTVVARGASVNEIVGKATPHRTARPVSTKRRAPAKHAARITARKPVSAPSQAELASRTVSRPQGSGVLAAGVTRTAAAAGPSPIPAPSASSSAAPTPLPLP